MSRFIRVAAIGVFFAVFWWTIPFMLMVPVVRITEIWGMLRDGSVVPLGRDLSFLAPCGLCLYYILHGHAVRALWVHWPWSPTPGMTMTLDMGKKVKSR